MNHDSIKVSVITVIYQGEKYLKQCLESLKNQTLQEVEFICIDNGSTDSSPEILKEMADDRFQCHFTEGFHGRPSYPCAVNFGIARARGEYVYILDGDDWLVPEALETLYEKAKSEDLDVLGFDTTVVFETESLSQRLSVYNTLYASTQNPPSCSSGKALFHFYKSTKQYQVNVFLYFCKRQFLKDNALKMTYMGGDNLYTFQVLLLAEKAAHLSQKLHFYYLHDHSGTTQDLESPMIPSLKYHMCYVDMLQTFRRYHLSKEKDPSFYEEMGRILNYVANAHLSMNPETAVITMETLLNQKNILLGEPLVSFRDIYISQEDFYQKRKEMKSLCFFGGGIRCQEEILAFQKENLPVPVAIIDNDPQKQGSKIADIPIISWERALSLYPDVHILLTSHRAYHEMLLELLEKIPRERIWFF